MGANIAGQPERAVGLTFKAMALNPSFADGYRDCLGWAYYRSGRYKEAAAALQRYLMKAPDDYYAHLGLAATLIELGREEEARAEVAEVLRIEPSYSLEIARQREFYKDPALLERYFAALHKAGLK